MSTKNIKQRRLQLMLSWRPIIDDVCAKHKIGKTELFSTYREERLMRARRELWARIKSTSKISYSDLGRRLGYSDHTSVRAGIRRFEREQGRLLV